MALAALRDHRCRTNGHDLVRPAAAPCQPPPLQVLLMVDEAEGAALLGLIAAVEPSIRPVVVAAETLATAAGELAWDLVLVRHQPPRCDALEFLASAAPPEPSVLVLADLPDESFALAALRAGALDCVGTAEPARLHQALTRELRNARRRRERAAAARELAVREARYRALVETSRDLVSIYRDDGVIEYQSPSSLAVLGYPPEAIIGRRAQEFLHPDDAGDLEVPNSLPWERLLRGEPVDIRVRHADGHWVVLEAVGRPVPGDDTRFVINSRDVTARRAADLSHARLAEAVEQAAEGIVITDLRGVIEYVNPAFERISGYRRDEVVGRTPRLVSSGHHDETFYRELWETLRRGEVWTGIFVNRRKSGTIYQEQATISPVRDGAGTITNYVAVKTDITEKLALEQKLLQAQKMEAVGRLAGGVAHDFNNLLVLLINHAEFINLALPPDSPIREDVNGILAAGTRAATLTRQLLTFSRREPAQAEQIDLNRTLRSVGKLTGHAAGEGVELVYALDETIPRVEVDPSQMEQVLMNLVLNARDAMPDGGRLTIGTGTVALDAVDALQTRLAPGEYVRLTVTDTGHGMTQDVLERIFEPYFTTKPRGKGTGLGLSTVYGIVTGSGGDVLVASQPDGGATFSILLPPVAGLAEGARDTAPEPESRPLGGGETLLVVEDEDAVRTVTRRILERRGYRVYDACCGPEALKFIGDFPERIDLLLTDMVMPQMSGRELADLFRRDRPETVVLYMSGYTDDVLERFGDLDSVLLQKPFGAEQLLGAVRTMLDQNG